MLRASFELIIVKRAEGESVLAKARQCVVTEAQKAEQLRTGVSSVELNTRGKVFEALGLVEE